MMSVFRASWRAIPTFDFDWMPCSIQECINTLMHNKEMPKLTNDVDELSFTIMLPGVMHNLHYVELYVGKDFNTSVSAKVFGNGIHVTLSKV
tara:strand:- start:34 stop:309 length:276 start_codon:yes stop_codon:yes gene_type:complete